MAATDRAVVLDTSVVVKWYASPEAEAHHREALEVLHRFTSGDLAVHCPALVRYEMGNALVKRAKDPEAGYRSFLDLPITIHDLEAPVLLRALERRRRSGGAFYDAAFSVLADELGIPLVTADAGQARRHGDGAFLLEAFVRRP